MAAIICPTVLAQSSEEYQQQMERIAQFAQRVHIDLADGHFARTLTVPIKEAWWPAGMQADLHVMYKQPFRHTKDLIELRPELVIVHAEAEGDFFAFADKLHSEGIAVGVALNPQTLPHAIEPALDDIDHVLIFSGNLGHFGGKADTHLLTKVLRLRYLKPTLEIGWDGGINEKNAATLAAGGVDVLNTGGFIQHAANPAGAYHALVEKVRSSRGENQT